MKKIMTFAIALVLMFGATGTTNAQISKALQRVFKRIDRDLGKYTYLGLPRTNFGVLSISSSSNNRFQIENLVCSTFKCLNTQPPTNLMDLINVDKKYVEVGTTAPISIDSEEDRKILLSAVLPSIQNLVGLNFGYSNKRKVDIELTAAKLYIRTMSKGDYFQYIYGLQNSNDPTQRGIFDLLDKGRLCMVISDLVIDELDLQVTVNKQTGTDIKAGLDGKIAQVVGQDAKVGVSLENAYDLVYKIKVREPMVLAILPLNYKDTKFVVTKPPVP